MSDGSISVMEEFLICFDYVVSVSNIFKFWVDCFIRFVFIMMLYV